MLPLGTFLNLPFCNIPASQCRFLGSQGFEDISPLLNPPYTQSLGGAVAHSPGLRGPLMTPCGDTRTVLDSRETVECGSPNHLGVTSTQVTFRGSR